MAWDFNESQLIFQRSCRDFSVRELRSLHKEYLGRPELPREGIKKMADMGLLGIMLPEKYGGQPGDFVTIGIACEEIAREYFELELMPVGLKVLGDCIAFCTEETQDELAPKFISGEVIGCLCMTEPQVGSDAAHIQTSAVRKGDHYVVNGEKTSISFGAYADYGLVTVVTDPAKGARGISLLVIPLNLPGISRTLIPHIGVKGLAASSIMFDNVRVPARYLCGEEGAGFPVLMRTLDYLRTSLAVGCIGLALISLEETVEYVKQRQAFGRPIGKFEGISFRLVDNFAQVEAAKLLCYKTFSLVDQGRFHEASIEAAMAKYLAPRVSFQAIWDCTLFHGHLGYSEEYPLGRRLMDCLSHQIADGTREIQEVVMVAGIMGKDMVAYT